MSISYKDCKNIIQEVLGMSLYSEQGKAVELLSDGNFVEVKMGEGKSIICVVTACMLSEDYKKIYIVSVNNYLAYRDYKRYRKVFKKLGLDVSFNIPIAHGGKEYKSDIFSSDIIYTSSDELIRDYLRYTTGVSKIKVNLECAIVDECDFVLLDEASNEARLYTKSSKPAPIKKYTAVSELVDNLKVCSCKNGGVGLALDLNNFDAVVDMSSKSAYLTRNGWKNIKNILEVDSVKSIDGLYRAIIDTVLAKYCYIRENDYFIKDDRIGIVGSGGFYYEKNESTNGLITALEIQEGLPVTRWFKGSPSLSYQSFYNKFDFLCGLTGTLEGAEDELSAVYRRDSYYVKPHFKAKRRTLETIIARTLEDKYQKLIYGLQDYKHVPILVVTNNDKECDIVTDLLIENLPSREICKIDKKNYEDTINIIDYKSGLPGNITVCTFATSRGIDVIIDKSVSDSGGLHVFSLGRFINNRIDNQVRGRTSRRGMNGSSQFIISLDDEIFDILPNKDKRKLKMLDDMEFNSKSYQKKMKRLVGKCQRHLCYYLAYDRKVNLTVYENLYNCIVDFNRDFVGDRQRTLDFIRMFLLNKLPYYDMLGIYDFICEGVTNLTPDRNIMINEIYATISSVVQDIDSNEWGIYCKQLCNWGMFANYNTYKELYSILFEKEGDLEYAKTLDFINKISPVKDEYKVTSFFMITNKLLGSV